MTAGGIWALAPRPGAELLSLALTFGGFDKYLGPTSAEFDLIDWSVASTGILKTPQVILLCSQGWELLTLLGCCGLTVLSGTHSPALYHPLPPPPGHSNPRWPLPQNPGFLFLRASPSDWAFSPPCLCSAHPHSLNALLSPCSIKATPVYDSHRRAFWETVPSSQPKSTFVICPLAAPCSDSPHGTQVRPPSVSCVCVVVECCLSCGGLFPHLRLGETSHPHSFTWRLRAQEHGHRHPVLGVHIFLYAPQCHFSSAFTESIL